MATEFEITARWKKATAFAAHLYSHGIVAEELSDIELGQWNRLAVTIGYNPPSGETVTAIGFIMRAFELNVANRIKEQQEKEQQTA